MSSVAVETVRSRPSARSDRQRKSVSLMVVVSVAMSMTVIVIVVSIMPVMAAIVVRLVFRGSYEVHRPIAGIVLAAVLAPIPRMPRRYV